MPSNIRLAATMAATEDSNRSRGTMPKQWVLDRIADKAMSGGYEKRNVLCVVCFVKRAVNGSCGCDS